MVSFNVAQLLQAAPGSVREFDFSERLRDPADDVPLVGPVRGHVKLMLTSRGILAQVHHRADMRAECSRCLDEVQIRIVGSFDEEFLPSTDLQTGLPKVAKDSQTEDACWIDELNTIDLDDLLAQSTITSVPLRPLCDANCPGLCTDCGERLTADHRRHPDEPETDLSPVEGQSPFAKLAILIQAEDADRR